MRTRVGVAIVLFGLILSVIDAGAVRRLRSDRELAEGADLIVMGQVTGTRGTLSKAQTSIHTVATLSVAEVLKGAAEETITFSCPGGRVGDGVMWTEEGFVPQRGMWILAFLRRDLESGYSLTDYQEAWGYGHVTWNGLTDQGRPVGSGVYLSALMIDGVSHIK